MAAIRIQNVEVRRASRDVGIGLLGDQWHRDLPSRARNLAGEVLCLNVDILGTPEVAAAEAQ